jgi:hypothetical protein
MIDNIRIYYKPKYEYENWFLKTKLLNDKNSNYNLKSGNKEYPITCSEYGINFIIDEYNSFISIHLKAFHNSTNYREKLSSIQNISFSQLHNILQKAKPYLLDVNKVKISQIQLTFSIPLEVSGKSVIEKNILMLNYKYYNHNKQKQKQKQKITKEFELTNFKITFIAEKKGDKSNYLNIILKMKKNVEFRGIQFIHQLLEKEKLKEMFSIFLKRYDQLIIVDSIESFEGFKGIDKSLMKKFMFYGYWTNTSEKISRQALCKQKKKFESLLSKYNLLKNKTTITKKLEIAFEEFISN